MLTIWYSHNGSRWSQAEKDNGSPVEYIRLNSARNYALKMAKQFHGTVQIRRAEEVIETLTKDTQPAPSNSRLARAVWVDCPGLREGKEAHFMRDHCWSCAPFWERLPICPHCRRKLLKYGRTKCKGCNTFVMVEVENTPENPA